MENCNNDYLIHYGVKGQKWGQRRYQNADGTLTPAGRKRINDTSNKTTFDDLTSDFRIRKSDGSLAYGYTTKTNVGSNKNVSVNLIIRDDTINSKTAKTKAQKAQRFIDNYDDDGIRDAVVKSNPNMNKNDVKLHILDIQPDSDRVYATYSSGRIEIEMSTNKVIYSDDEAKHSDSFDDELQHWGIKGQKWGQRRYQNKDGSLTPAGQKRYNKEMEAIKKEKAKVKEAEKVQANKKKTHAKIDKLEAEKAKLAERKKALKEEKRGGKKGDSKNVKDEGLSVEERRAKLLKSSDPNELYKNRDLLTTEEIKERLGRIDQEAKLAAVAASTQKTGMDRINKALDYARKGDEIYKFVTGSQVGKDLAKALGLSNEKSSEFDLGDFVKNMNKKSNDEIKNVSQRIKNENSIRDEFNKRENKKKADEEYAKKQAEETKKAKEETKKAKEKTKDETERFETTGDDVVGEGTSRSNIKDDWERTNTSSRKSSNYYDPVDSYGDWMNDATVSNVPATVSRRGEDVIYGLLEDGRRR